MTQVNDLRWWNPPESAYDLAQEQVEVWVPFQNLLVSNMGQVMRARRWLGDVDSIHNAKYVQVIPHRRGKALAVSVRGQVEYVHRVVAVAFAFASPAAQIYHINRDKADNRLCNLKVGRPRLTETEKDSLLQMLQAGRPVSEIARAFQTTTAHIAHYKRRNPPGVT